MRRNNQGVTLIEMIFVITILSILAGGAVIGLRSLDSGNTRSTVDKISAMLNYTRVLNMSKDNTYTLVIEQKVDSSYEASIRYIDPNTNATVIQLTEKLKLKNGSISYTANNSGLATNYTLACGVSDLEISFEKTSGALSTGSKGDVKSITIIAGGRTIVIDLVTATGKHYIE